MTHALHRIGLFFRTGKDGRKKPDMRDMIALGLASTAYLAQAATEPGAIGLLEKGGTWGAFLAVLWWMMTKFDRKLDEIGKAIERLASVLDKRS